MNPEVLEPVRIRTLDDFLKWIQRLTYKERLFRGVSNVDYKIEASANRLQPSSSRSFEGFLKINEELIKDARLQGLGLRDVRELGDLEILAALQHAGAATCLIDFTYSALIALWFACENDPSNETSDGKVVAVFNEPSKFTKITPKLLKKEVGCFLKNPVDGASELYQWSPWRELTNRIGAQQSIFVFGNVEIEPDVVCLIDKDQKNTLRMQLREIGNITEAILFPDLDGFARRHSHSALKTELSSNVYKKSGEDAYKIGNHSGAIANFNEAIALDQSDPDIYYQRGLAKYNLEQYEAAIADFNEAIALDQSDPNIYYQRGLAKYNLEQYEAAIADFNVAIRLEPNRAEVYYQRGMGHFNLRDYKKAIVDFNKVIDLDENHRWIYYNRGQAQYHLENFDEAKRDIETASQKAEKASDIDLINRIGEFMRISRLPES